MSRRQKAFDEGRRSAKVAHARNPYENPKLKELWIKGREQEQAGTIKTPLPPLAHGKTRARAPGRNQPIPRQRPGGPRSSFGGSGGFGGGGGNSSFGNGPRRGPRPN